MGRGMVTEKECTEMIDACCKAADYDYSRTTITEFLFTINTEIHPFHLKIRKGRREDNGESVYTLVSLVENELNRLVANGDFSRQELDYLKKLIDLIVQSDNTYSGSISSIAALNLADEIKPTMSKGDTKKFLARLVEEKWLYESQGFYMLTPRTMLELEQYLMREHEDMIPECPLCNATVLHGKTCVSCSKRIHLYCAAQFIRTQKNDPKCIGCGTAWPDDFVSNLQLISSLNSASEQDVSVTNAPPTNTRSTRKRHLPR